VAKSRSRYSALQIGSAHKQHYFTVSAEGKSRVISIIGWNSASTVIRSIYSTRSFISHVPFSRNYTPKLHGDEEDGCSPDFRPTSCPGYLMCTLSAAWRAYYMPRPKYDVHRLYQPGYKGFVSAYPDIFYTCSYLCDTQDTSASIIGLAA